MSGWVGVDGRMKKENGKSSFGGTDQLLGFMELLQNQRHLQIIHQNVKQLQKNVP